MPITPFIGLSVLVHIGIVIAYKFFRWTPSLKIRKDDTFILRSLGFIIITLTFIIMLTTATLLVYASTIDKYSSIHLAEHYINKVIALVSNQYVFDDAIEMKANTTIPAVVRRAIVPADCPKPFHKLANLYHGSIVDYLAAKNYDYSFAARKKNASDFGIPDYQGTYEQNQILLMEFFMKFNELPALDSQLCRQAGD